MIYPLFYMHMLTVHVTKTALKCHALAMPANDVPLINPPKVTGRLRVTERSEFIVLVI